MGFVQIRSFLEVLGEMEDRLGNKLAKPVQKSI